MSTIAETPSQVSVAQSLASLPEALRTEALGTLTEEQAAELLFDWRFWARPDQLPPEGGWRIWLVLAGRGWGKTRVGAEWVRAQVANGCKRVAIVGRTAADVRDTMVEGESGILACCPEGTAPPYEPPKRRLTWPNGAIATTYSADEPKNLRGPQHDAAWADELATWRDTEAWDNLLLGLRLGDNPKVVVTTTPKPQRLLRAMVTDPTVHVTRGTTYDNLANLAPAFQQEIIGRYEGTRLGRQELRGEILEDVEGALWSRSLIDAARVKPDRDEDGKLLFVPPLRRIVVAIDPAVTSGEESDDTGIIVAGIGDDGAGYVLQDATCKDTPGAWAAKAIGCFDNWQADRIVAEVNNGGDLVEANIRTVRATVPYQKVHASRGKRVRAEPIAALYEQGRIHHVGEFAALEDQMCNFAPDVTPTGDSPDRVDALVWALWALGFVQPRAVLKAPRDYRRR